jgi:hypothetical protein
MTCGAMEQPLWASRPDAHLCRGSVLGYSGAESLFPQHPPGSIRYSDPPLGGAYSARAHLTGWADSGPAGERERGGRLGPHARALRLHPGPPGRAQEARRARSVKIRSHLIDWSVEAGRHDSRRMPWCGIQDKQGRWPIIHTLWTGELRRIPCLAYYDLARMQDPVHP